MLMLHPLFLFNKIMDKVEMCIEMKYDILQLHLKGGVYSIDGTKAVVDSMMTTLPAETEPSNKKVDLTILPPKEHFR